MQCTIYALDELKKKRRIDCERVLVLARSAEALVLMRDEINAMWKLPERALAHGESAEETARSALGEALGEAVYDMRLLCGYSITDEAGKESGGYVYLADVKDWPDEKAAPARVFERLPLPSQTADAALVFALHRFAGEFFDERLDIEQLGQPALL